ncbi:unnamed protein product [Anisakis simplex]|uniref:Uncharacterized protein n=1 Tax=Anisakis simplex TaxID=6269 RepID=A0A0M3JE84_ANISI|nr:unnamed protein product [Anisakis simplex]
MRHVPDRDRQSVSFVNVAARLRGAARRRTRGSAAMRAEQFLEEHSTDRQTRQAASIVRAVRASARDSTSSSLHRLPFFSDITSLGVSSTAEARRHSSAASRSYYYRLKLFPSKKSGKGIKLKVFLPFLKFFIQL